MPATPAAATWRPATETDHPLAAADLAPVGDGVRLLVEVGPRARSGATHFRAFLHAGGLGRTREAVLHGLHHAGRLPAQCWLEVTEVADRVPVDSGEVEVPEGIVAQLVLVLGRLVPPGGHLVMGYDAPHQYVTAQALAAGVPAAATPVGAMMFSAGCGVAFKDWPAGGGREGRRRLQGFRATDDDHAQRRAIDGLQAMEAFMERSKDLDWGIQIACRPLAEQVIGVLRERLNIGDGPVPLNLDAHRR
ncbi:MAG: DUF1122 family protein [Chloroflexi bacterium]|nr:DUF1122 family protein [Chloroflexota bacterium]